MYDWRLEIPLIERDHLSRFREFYAQLKNKSDIFFMFFTSGLLHWVYRSLRLVPCDVNVVLIGSDLRPEELVWIRSNFDRPFHHLGLPGDDKTVWEFLFQTNERNFGWMDIDCFVLNPELFRMLADIDRDAAVNCTWSFVCRPGVRTLFTYFIFLNVEVIRAVGEKIPVSPSIYTYQRSQIGRRPPYAFSRVLTPEIVELLRGVIPTAAGKDPEYLTEPYFFDTLQVYQMVANALGYRLHRVRPLELDISDELIHVGKVSYYRTGWGAKDSPQKRQAYALILQSDYLMLHDLVPLLPGLYARRAQQLSGDLERLGASTDLKAIRAILCAELTRRGTSEQALAKILDLGPALGS